MAKEVKEVYAFVVKGQINLAQDTNDCIQAPAKLLLKAYNSSNQCIGSSFLDKKGNFSFEADLKQAESISVVVTPEADDASIKRIATYNKRFSTEDWRVSRTGAVLEVQETIASAVWRPWWPKYICISGNIRKQLEEAGITKYCPVPFVKVEIYDVDREFCLWPWLRANMSDILKRPVIKVPELIKKPFPIPDPGPLQEITDALQPISLTRSARQASIKSVESSLIDQLNNLTISSSIAPWIYWPHCFYSKKLICSTTTDCNGDYKCCFNWWPFQFRNGYFRYDSSPDIIIKVTQIIDGVEQVIYLDPYTNVRWNTNSATIDLTLDDDEIICGNGCGVAQPEGTTTFFTRIGNDNVYDINQTSGTFEAGAWSHVAYGGNLDINAVFGDALSNGVNKRYYRLSIRKAGSGGAFTDINVPLADTRVDKGSLLSETRTLGPFNINGTANLYEIRDRNTYYWYNVQKIGRWRTEDAVNFPKLKVDDEDKYLLRLEVFDQNGNQLDSSQIDYRDGTVSPGNVLPAMADRCDLVIQVDNKAPVLDIQIPDAAGACGVVQHDQVPFDIHTKVTQENGRLYHWKLTYNKGLTGGGGLLGIATNTTGLATPDDRIISSMAMTSGLSSTCAFSLLLQAYPLVRNGYGMIHHRQINRAVAVEKCNC
jgi:hypothetical protein